MSTFPLRTSFVPRAVALAVLLVSAACAAATPAVPPPAPTTAPATAAIPLPSATQPALPTVTALPPTKTPLPPTANAVPATRTPAPSATAPFGPAQENGFTAWCLPEYAALPDVKDALHPPADARVGAVVSGAMEVRNLPVSACVFAYTFNQPAAAGLKLLVYEHNNKNPWLTADLLPVESHPETVAAVLRHGYIIAPPLWEVSYEFAVADAAGKELRRDTVNLHRWTPELCWNGQRPNPLTLRCPLPQDLHPWDPSYGTPIPTFPPKED